MRKYNTWKRKPYEADYIKKTEKNATVCGLYMLGSMKNCEHKIEERKCKGRIVALGSNVRFLCDGSKKKFSGFESWCRVSSLAGAKAIMADALIRNGQVHSIDLESAYLQTDWGESYSHYARLCPGKRVILITLDYARR